MTVEYNAICAAALLRAHHFFKPLIEGACNINFCKSYCLLATNAGSNFRVLSVTDLETGLTAL
jgi:hypothetical protein